MPVIEVTPAIPRIAIAPDRNERLLLPGGKLNHVICAATMLPGQLFEGVLKGPEIDVPEAACLFEAYGAAKIRRAIGLSIPSGLSG